MRIAGYRPRNTYLQRQLDHRWHRWLLWCALGAGGLAVVLGGIVGPRQTTVRLRYEIAQIKSEVDALERERRALLLQLESETSPNVLAPRAADLGLAVVPPDRLLFLTSSGELVGLNPPTQPPPASPTGHD